jgi:hypothetical protein
MVAMVVPRRAPGNSSHQFGVDSGGIAGRGTRQRCVVSRSRCAAAAGSGPAEF